MKTFNIAGKCIPFMHYMVDISRQVNAAAALVQSGNFFCINRGRQYGKTTTLACLKRKLEAEGYAVFSLSFEGLDDDAYTSSAKMVYASVQAMNACIEWNASRNLSDSTKDILAKLQSDNATSKAIDNRTYYTAVSRMSMTDRIVLIIDEVDQVALR